MVLKRIMPCLLFNGSGLVKTKTFKDPVYVGDPINAIKIYNEKEVDEIIMIDINATKQNRKINFDKIKEFTSECFMPFTYAGGVKLIHDFKELFSIGIEKVAVNDLILSNPNVIKEAVASFGSQSVVGVIDVVLKDSTYLPFSYMGKKIPFSLEEYIKYCSDELKVGEILLQNVSREGTWMGFDYTLLSKVNTISKIPVIGLGGAKNVDDIKLALYECNLNAVALGSMAVFQKKDMGVLIRFPKRNLIFNE